MWPIERSSMGNTKSGRAGSLAGQPAVVVVAATPLLAVPISRDLIFFSRGKVK